MPALLETHLPAFLTDSLMLPLRLRGRKTLELLLAVESVLLRPLKLQPLEEPGLGDSVGRGVDGEGIAGRGFVRSTAPPRLAGAGDWARRLPAGDIERPLLTGLRVGVEGTVG